METLFVYFGMFVFFFVLGLILVLKGSSRPAPSLAPDPVVGQDLVRVKEELQAAQAQDSHLKAQLDTLAVELQQAQEKAQAALTLEEGMARLRQDGRDKERLIGSLENDLQFLKQRADGQAREAIGALEMLQAREAELQSRIFDLQSRFDEEEYRRLKEENRQLREQVPELQRRLNEGAGRAAEVETEYEGRLARSQQEAGRARGEMAEFQQGLRQLIERIAEADRELEVLKEASDDKARRHAVEISAQDARSRDEISRLKSELVTLQDAMRENHSAASALEEQLKREREQLAAARARVEELQAQTRAVPAPRSVPVPSGEEWQLKEEIQRIQTEKAGLEQRLGELDRENAFLTKKEQLMQAELIRNRTEALGLKRICEGFRRKLDQAAAG
jgi:chromosome segregation ATPase